MKLDKILYTAEGDAIRSHNGRAIATDK